MPKFFRALFLISWFVAHEATAASSLRAFVEQHCLDCHSGEGAEADLRLDELAVEFGHPETFATWVKVHDKIAAGDMPPPDVEQLEDSQIKPVLGELAGELRKASAARQRDEGRVQFRRLNRVEYENTLRDLVAMPHLEIKEMLPADAQQHGFDNVGSALRVSYVQMARYLDAADEALDQAGRLLPQPQHYKFRLPLTEIHRFEITKDRVTIGDEAVLLRQPNTAQTPWRIDAVEIPFPGSHTIRVRGRAATYKQEKSEPVDGELLPPERSHNVSLYQGTRYLGSFELTAEPKVCEVTAHLFRGETIYLYVSTLDDWNPKWTNNPYTGPAVALEWIEVQGPAEVTWPSPNNSVLYDDLPVTEWTEEADCIPPAELGALKHHKRYPKMELPHKKTRYMVVSEQPEKDSRRLLKRFMDRAFRRPYAEEEVDRYLVFVLEELEKRKPFHEALLTGYKAVLCSPDFLYFYEEPGKLDDYALASRLSYFLWRSMPDDELRTLAERGELGRDEVLREQVDRMLADPKIERFVDDFTGQWLEMREITFTQPDEKLYPEFDQFLLESMIAETKTFFREMLNRDLPASAVIDSDIAFINNVLADLYGIEGVEGVAIREVSLPEKNPRGGLLTQASLLKITANGTTTSPVVRGSWVLDRLLGTPPPPPPPNVPAIEPDTRGATTVRELLAKHRADPACASCHRKIDPPGFALESFDVIGGWREKYRSLENGEKPAVSVDGRQVNYRLGPEVDPSGSLTARGEFEDIRQFKALLLEDQRQVARNLTERLLVYATGAGISFADRQVVEQILDSAEENDYGIRTLIHEIVQSDTFQSK